MAKQFKPGGRVKWDTPQGETQGTVVRKLASKAQIKGHTAKADPEHPQYLVESEKTGSRAAHKPDALKEG